ncbi:MAG: hypothetical protein UU98_C0024G0021 [Parcubacteria group bacterium GW2011_GWD2_42_14]|nr:MAG: hypothetical protein UU98_C0024G0021 [Parcubacteria group bacterium GW2011_GWD2_42_14]
MPDGKLLGNYHSNSSIFFKRLAQETFNFQLLTFNFVTLAFYDVGMI